MAENESGGRGKSPGSAAGQFKVGQSGNPGGRPAGSRNRATVIREVLSERVSANIKGEQKKIPVTEAFTRKLVIKALEGDLKSIRDAMALWEDTEARLETVHESAYHFDDRDREVINALYERMMACDDEAWLA